MVTNTTYRAEVGNESIIVFAYSGGGLVGAFDEFALVVQELGAGGFTLPYLTTFLAGKGYKIESEWTVSVSGRGLLLTAPVSIFPTV